ncbi:cytochrome c oxidase subunit 4 [Agrococcus sp. SCSIO52902]|uniref:aa3-type cytochrome oxidase subunit IV n=1 Tax=Agrococcus sp. SCSIO52902 TaxID=2933290 RepID=UPI001FF5B2F9|nr:cytochrome c oxidase subunit 4 [Agrococcus sp. SCSIO52902]UOW00237.1 cytochrome c oxidase subunit 4 [Agrococcus sp. SCSIO52902]
MRSNIVILTVIAVFFYLCAAVYTVWHMGSYDGRIEWAGTLGMALVGVMCTLIAFYLVLVHRGQHGELAMDRLDAELDEDDPDQGHFSPWSWWPIALAGALAVMFLSLAGPTFLIPIGAGLLAIVMVGWVYEYYRGNFSR